MNDIAPIVVFAYNRKDKLMECLEALSDNYLADRSDVFVFADGARNEKDLFKVEEVRQFLDDYSNNHRFKTFKVVKAEKNQGLANSVIGGVTQVINEYGRVIVVEDDLLTRKNFLAYMNGALNYYKNNQKYGSVSAYTYPLKSLKTYKKDIYVTSKGDCWGWGTWKDRWDNVDWEIKDFGEYLHNRKMRKQFEFLEIGADQMLVNQMQHTIDSWAIRWCYHLLTHGQWTIYPKVSKTYNIGLDGSGTNCGNRNKMKLQELAETKEVFQFEMLDVDMKKQMESAVYEKGIITIIKSWIKYSFSIK